MEIALFTIFAVVNEATGGSTPPISKIKCYEYLENSSKLHLYFFIGEFMEFFKHVHYLRAT